MPKYSLAHYQFKRYVEEERHTETEAAAAEGRCHGQLTSEAYAHVKAQADSVYRDPFERLDFWTAVEAGLIDGGAERMHDEALAAMPQPTFLDLARAAVEAERIWCRGTSATIWQNERHAATVSYSASVGDLYLVLEKDTERVSVRCARLPMFVPGADVGGYVFTLTDDDYQKWAEKAREL